MEATFLGFTLQGLVYGVGTILLVVCRFCMA